MAGHGRAGGAGVIATGSPRYSPGSGHDHGVSGELVTIMEPAGSGRGVSGAPNLAHLACGRRHAPGWRRPQDEDPPPLVATLVTLRDVPGPCRGAAQPSDPAGDRSAPRTKVPLRDSRFPHNHTAPSPSDPYCRALCAAWGSSYTRCASSITARYNIEVRRGQAGRSSSRPTQSKPRARRRLRAHLSQRPEHFLPTPELTESYHQTPSLRRPETCPRPVGGESGGTIRCANRFRTAGA
jgi:hypothetical protein